MVKSFILALNAAAATAAITFRGVEVSAVYDTVHMQETFSSDDYSLTANWGSAELMQGDMSAHVLAMAFMVGGVDIVDATSIATTATFKDPAMPGATETWTCSVNYTKPPRDNLLSDKVTDTAEGGKT